MAPVASKLAVPVLPLKFTDNPGRVETSATPELSAVPATAPVPEQLALTKLSSPLTCFPDCCRKPVSVETVVFFPLVLVSATCQFPESAPGVEVELEGLPLPPHPTRNANEITAPRESPAVRRFALYLQVVNDSSIGLIFE